MGRFSVGTVVPVRLLRGCALLGIGCLGGRAAYGQENPRIVVDCALLDAEHSAEVEARVRATLLAAQLREAQVSITCAAPSAQVDVEVGPRSAQLSVETEAPELRGRLLDAVDRALRQLEQLDHRDAAPAVALAPVPATPPPAAPSTPTLAPPPAAAPPRPVASRRPAQVPAVWELTALGVLESWSDDLTAGGKAGASFGARALRFGATLGGAVLVSPEPGFPVHEWNGALDVTWQPAWAYGLRAGVGVGASVLTAVPSAGLTPRHGTTASAWFAELAISRPVHIAERWSLAPRFAGRFFGAQRHINVNDVEALALNGFAPSLGLVVLYRVE